MTKTQRQKSTKKTNAMADSNRNRRKEFRLDLPLPAKAEGKSATGKAFKETTTIVNISSLGAYFSLNALITIGTKLTINIELPSQLTEGKKLKLKLRGKVVRLEMSTIKNKKQGVALNFDEEFKSEDIRFIAED
jgi:c-di-GMP-binding flagellar brake protein YcgR